MLLPPPRSTLFPYTTLFRSACPEGLKFLVASSPDLVAVALSTRDRKSTRLNSSHRCISYAVFCLKKKKKKTDDLNMYRTNDHITCGEHSTTKNTTEFYVRR